jgi:hypothetical protein
VDPSKLELNKDDPKIVALIGVWESMADALARLGTPLEWEGDLASVWNDRDSMGHL